MFYVLVALADGDTHGYQILKDVEQLTSGAVRLSTGTLYGIIKRLLNDGLIREFGRGSEAERRRSYELTAFGRDVARAEAARPPQHSYMPPERWFRRLFPSDFRGDFGDEMTDVFRD
jgi:DNA-binding PadR family transcriptional regulator